MRAALVVRNLDHRRVLVAHEFVRWKQTETGAGRYTAPMQIRVAFGQIGAFLRLNYVAMLLP